ncbi:MAG: hypothetical protein DSY90_01485 [Deltaproteobacteria bacterium]|nr:MAG: hypothetical protein DSY90_01485 [Deltaproteobacteria bacterium]
MSEKKNISKTSVKQVLIVDNNEDLLISLKEGMRKYRSRFSVLLANNGEKALEVLKHESVSVVVSDVKMPKMNGLELLLNITNDYPEIPVIIITAYGREELEWMARRSGAVAFISKPFSLSELSNKILTLLKKESDGGVIKSISTGVFMQLAEMEEMTCTIRVHSDADDTVGVVFFRDGKLLDARYGDKIGDDAIFIILALEKTQIRIQNSCPATVEPKIRIGLQAVLLEAMRLKDEADFQEAVEPADNTVEPAPGKTVKENSARRPPAKAAATLPKKKPVQKRKRSAKKILRYIQEKTGKKIGTDQIHSDRDWEHSITLALKIGDLFKAGRLQCGYIHRKNEQPVFFIPGSPSAILNVDRMSPRDRMFNIARQID